MIPSSAGGTQSTIQTRTWLAIRGTNTSEGTQVVGPLTRSATTTAYHDEAGQTITATPFAYTPPTLSDTTRTATGGDIVFSQGERARSRRPRASSPWDRAGAARASPAARSSRPTCPTTSTSTWTASPARPSSRARRPGAGVSFNPLVAAPFASVSVAGTPSNPGGVPSKPSVRTDARGTALSGGIVSRSLVAKRGKVRVRVSCPAGGPDCAGSVRRARTPVRIGRRKPVLLNLARALRYAMPAGGSRTLTLVLSADAKALLRRRATQRVRLTLQPVKGRAASRNLTLRGG